GSTGQCLEYRFAAKRSLTDDEVPQFVRLRLDPVRECRQLERELRMEFHPVDAANVPWWQPFCVRGIDADAERKGVQSSFAVQQGAVLGQQLDGIISKRAKRERRLAAA